MQILYKKTSRIYQKSRLKSRRDKTDLRRTIVLGAIIRASIILYIIIVLPIKKAKENTEGVKKV